MRGITIALLSLLSGACKKESVVDCKQLVADPGAALTQVMNVSDDPAKIWDILERCFAPEGDTCERAAIGGQMVPSMAVSDGSADRADRVAGWKAWAERCRKLAPEMQRCLLISYATAHPECTEVADGLRKQLQ